MSVSYITWVTRDIVKAYPNTLFVFGDNLTGTGFGGQAKEMRGEPNAIGIPTKHFPNMHEKSFFTDADLDNWLIIVKPIVARLHAHTGPIRWPQNGIGTGLAQLPKRAPAIAKAIQEIHDKLAS